LVFLLLYRFAPNRQMRWRYVWPGALVAAVLFEIAKSLFLWYLENFASYNQVYGSLASVIVLMFWAYLSSMLLNTGRGDQL
ncbi:MAG TPA: YihY/virulence factor BrkB family protein, partial [Dehalococcoidia bacterium]|nr:YihY/virulence factor BrkB family protein [Dehalococcoidia bacterium]